MGGYQGRRARVCPGLTVALVCLTGCLAALLGGPAQGAETPNLALKRPYTLVPETNYALCTDEGDATQLTDGELLGDQQLWIQTACVGWKLPLDGEAEAIIDLGAVHAIDAIRFRTSCAPTADVYLPAARSDEITENGRPAARSEGVSHLRTGPGVAVFRLGSGQYSFTVPTAN